MCSDFTQKQAEGLLSVALCALFGELAPSLGLCSGLPCTPSALNYPQLSHLLTYDRMGTHPYCGQNSLVFFSFTVTKMYLFFLWLHNVAFRILVPRPRIKPMLPALGTWSLNHWTIREVSKMYHLKCIV